MNKVSFEALKLKTYLEYLERNPSLDNATKLLHELESMKNENFQFIQDVFLSRLLILMDSADGLKKNEFKTTLLKSMNIILKGSRIMKDLPYKTILCIVLKQIFDYPTNSYKKDLPEELKIAVFECFMESSCALDFEVIEKFMVNDNKILLGQCIFVCKEAIARETYLKLRKSAVEALMCLTQCHDKFDQNDIVLREQISKVLFIVLPQVATVLIKVCQEDCLRGPHLIQAALKCFGRFLCLILQDYDKKHQKIASNEQFLMLINPNIGDEKLEEVPTKITKLNVEKAEKSSQWMATTSQNLSKIIVNLKSLRGSEHSKIRHEFAVLSYVLLSKCLSSCKLFMRFLLENLILFADDSDKHIQSFSQDGLKELSSTIPNINQEISELFSIHLTSMPRIVLTGLESEQYAALALINSYLKIFTGDSHLEALFENPVLLERFINVMTSCSEIDASKELIFYETSSSNALSDEYYKMKMPWKNFKNLKNEAVAGKYLKICKNLGNSKFIGLCVNFIMDNVDSLEYLVLLNEILSHADVTSSNLQIEQLFSIMDEFLSETYWSLPTKAVSQVPKADNSREEWFQDSTPGLYESAIEIRLRDVKLDEYPENNQNLTLKTIKYNILCTCTILELTGNVAVKLGSKFQRFVLRCLHLVLEKAGNSNFLIKAAGLYALECISQAMGHTEIGQLIDTNSDYLLFNINKLLRHNHENEAIIDMMSVVFRYSTISIAAYVEDIVEMAASQIVIDKNSGKATGYLKLFSLYVESVRQWNIQNEKEVKVDEKTDWNEFLQQCLYELYHFTPEESAEPIPDENVTEPEAVPNEEPNDQAEVVQEELPQHVELIIKVLASTLPYFASASPKEVILAHEIFLNGFPVLHVYESQFLPLVHQMWYPFTRQIQGKDFVILQHSIRLLSVIGKYAKDFVYKRSMDQVIPVVNKFLKSSYSHTNKSENLSYTQEFKLQKEVLSDYGQLTIDLGIDEKQLDEIIDILMMFHLKHVNDQLKAAAQHSIDVIKQRNPLLIKFKYDFQ